MAPTEPLSGDHSTNEPITSSAREDATSVAPPNSTQNGGAKNGAAQNGAGAADKAVNRPAKPAAVPGEKPVREPKLDKVELVKQASDQLRGTIAIELFDTTTTGFGSESKTLLKFHGLYEQEDRDARKNRAEAAAAGEGRGEKSYNFMMRTRLPGGQLTPEQYLEHDRLADDYANHTLRITTRQCFQFHGILKGDLQSTLRRLNGRLITTLGACGDVVRNVACCPAPYASAVRKQVEEVTRQISTHLTPRTAAYHEIWIDNEKVHDGEKLALDAGEALDAATLANGGTTEEPIYGKTYLPRKFKIAVAYPGDNCVDIYTQDIGLVAIIDGEGDAATLRGFNVVVGGGMGMNHTKADTFPRLADPLAFVRTEQVIPVVETIVKVQRDYGNRTDRKHARMKYLIHNWGIDRFRGEVEERLGYALQPFAAMPPLENELHLGWNEQGDGKWFLGISVENGRLSDVGNRRVKSGLRAVVEQFNIPVRLTANHDVLLTDIAPEDRAGVDALLREYGLDPHAPLSNVQLYSMACVALPTCGLAVAESERALPGVIDELEVEVARLGLADETISVRMTGCPNGCARPYVADIAFVGRSLDQYLLLLGGRSNGTRLNVPYKDLVRTDDLVRELSPLLAFFRDSRHEEETFGDFCERTGVDALRAHADAFFATVGEANHDN